MLVKLDCPACGANVDIDDFSGKGNCCYCGSKVMLQEPNNDSRSEIKGLLERAEAFIQLGDWDSAEEEYAQVRQRFPNDYRGWWGLCLIVTKNLNEYAAPEKYQGFMEQIRKLTERYPDAWNRCDRMIREYEIRIAKCLSVQKNIRTKAACYDGHFYAHRRQSRNQSKVPWFIGTAIAATIAVRVVFMILTGIIYGFSMIPSDTFNLVTFWISAAIGLITAWLMVYQLKLLGNRRKSRMVSEFDNPEELLKIRSVYQRLSKINLQLNAREFQELMEYIQSGTEPEALELLENTTGCERELSRYLLKEF